MVARTIIAIGLAAILAGCASSSGVRWYAPATWFSAREAKAADNADAKQDAAREAAVKAAQRLTHEAAEALAAAPASRPVEVATEANAGAVALLDQAAGPLTAADLAAVRKQVAGLLSDNAALRAEAEAARAKNRESLAALSERLARADAAVAAAQRDLRSAFDRENALANELRAQRALAWIVGSVAVLCAAGWIYLRFAVGGLPRAAGLLMRDLRQAHPDTAKIVAPLFDSYLNRHEQAAIARHAQ